ncbi:MAG: PhzF family phenazine biosynthesis protein [Lautropia sp.]
MPTYRFRLVNVFVGDTLQTDNALAGNPLCVFEDATGLADRQLMALARQFNLSETTFILPAPPSAPGEPAAIARVRIFTPTADPALVEMRFAGHPTLGTAQVLRALHGGDAVTLALPAGRVPVAADGDVWTLTAPFSGRPGVRPEPMPAADVAAIVGLATDDLAGPPTWLDTGTEQLLVPLRSVAAVGRARPSAARVDAWPRNPTGASNIYVFAFDRDAGGSDGRQRVRSRFFIRSPGTGNLYEDPGTGSACANLGGWLLANGHPLPARLAIDQGIEMQRPCRLLLDVGRDGTVRVGGRVAEIARGEALLQAETALADDAAPAGDATLAGDAPPSGDAARAGN